MANFRVWIEKTRKGSFQVRSEDKNGKRSTHYSIEKYESATIEGNLLVGKTLAKAYKKIVQEKFHRNELGECDLTLSLADLMERDLGNRLVGNIAKRTLSHNRMSFNAFLRETSCKTLQDLMDGDKLKDWKMAMYSAKVASETIRGRLADLHGFLCRLREEKIVSSFPWAKKMLPRKQKKAITFYTVSEFKDLDEALVLLGLHEARIMVHLAHTAGLRECEAAGHQDGRPGALMEDIIWPDGPDDLPMLHLRPEVVKGGENGMCDPRTVPLHESIIELLGSRRTGPLVQLTRNQAYKHFAKARKLSKINPALDVHGLRHTFAKNFIQKGKGPVGELKALMGHKTLAALDVYTRFEATYFAETIKRAHERRVQEEAILNANAQKGPIFLAGQL